MTASAPVSVPVKPAKKPRRTPEELKAHLQAQIRALDERGEAKDKRALEKLAGVLLAFGERRKNAQLQQASGLVSALAAAIKVTPVQ